MLHIYIYDISRLRVNIRTYLIPHINSDNRCKWRLWSHKFKHNTNPQVFIEISEYNFASMFTVEITPNWRHRSSWLLRSVGLYLFTDVSNSLSSQLEGSSCLNYEDGKDRLPETSVYKYRHTLCNNTEDWRPNLRRGMRLNENYFLMSVEILASPSYHMVETEQKCTKILSLRIPSKNGKKRNLLPEHLVSSTLLDMIRYDMIWYIFNCNWVATRWQLFSTHIHTNNTGNVTNQTIQRTQKYIEQHNN